MSSVMNRNQRILFIASIIGVIIGSKSNISGWLGVSPYVTFLAGIFIGVISFLYFYKLNRN